MEFVAQYCTGLLVQYSVGRLVQNNVGLVIQYCTGIVVVLLVWDLWFIMAHTVYGTCGADSFVLVSQSSIIRDLWNSIKRYFHWWNNTTRDLWHCFTWDMWYCLAGSSRDSPFHIIR
jgi:hypothetical protein